MLRCSNRKGRKTLTSRFRLHTTARLLVERVGAEERYDYREPELLAHLHLRVDRREIVHALLLFDGIPVEAAAHNTEAESVNFAQRRLVEGVCFHLHADVHRHRARRQVICTGAKRRGNRKCCNSFFHFNSYFNGQ